MRPAERPPGPLAVEIGRFVAHWRALGRRFDTEAATLALFDRNLSALGVRSLAEITPAVVEGFLCSRPRHRPRSFNHLVGVLRRFFTWLVARGVLACSPLRVAPRREGAQRLPVLLGPEHAQHLLQLAAALPDLPGTRLRGPVFHLAFALLYGLGLRVGEVCRLDVSDFDRRQRLLIVRGTKFGKDRWVPFGPRLHEALLFHLARRRAIDGRFADDAPLLTVRPPARLGRQAIGRVFRQLVPQLGLETSAAPRLHDLRHSFATRTLLRWYRSGADPGARLLQLSTFLGHVRPESTAVYLTVTADLFEEAGRRFEAFSAGGRPR